MRFKFLNSPSLSLKSSSISISTEDTMGNSQILNIFSDHEPTSIYKVYSHIGVKKQYASRV